LASRRSQLGAFLLAVACICAPAGAQTVFDVAPGPPRPSHRAGAGRDYPYSSGYQRTYLFNVLPGAVSLVLSYPAGDFHLNPRVSVFDRWPYDPGANRYDLPMGPAAPADRRRIEFRWSMDISPASTSTLLYVSVEVPPGAGVPGPFPIEVFVTGPSPSPMFSMEKGITHLTGPSGLVLGGGQAPAALAADRAAQPFDAKSLPPVVVPGDLVRNGSFGDGLNHWTPHRDRVAADNVASVSLSDGILRLAASRDDAREGVMQKLHADVTGASSLLLMAEVMVKEQTQGGLGPEGRDAPVAIAVGYRSQSGGGETGGRVFWKGFYALDPENPGKETAGRKVSKGRWYRSVVDLMQLDPKPATILFLSLEGSGWPAREGWIRDVHLIQSGGNR